MTSAERNLCCVSDHDPMGNRPGALPPCLVKPAPSSSQSSTIARATSSLGIAAAAPPGNLAALI